MSLEEYRPIGTAMIAMMRRVERLINRRLLPALERREASARGVVTDVITETWMAGATTGYMLHGAYLGAPASMPPSLARALAEQALHHGEWTAGRIRSALEQREIDGAALSDLARISSQVALWRGHDVASRAVAGLTEAGYKRWVRSWPRKQQREHSVLEGQVLPEHMLYQLPSGARVYGPRDWDRYPEPSEWINCGHALVYMRDVSAREVLYNPPSATMYTGGD